MFCSKVKAEIKLDFPAPLLPIRTLIFPNLISHFFIDLKPDIVIRLSWSCFSSILAPLLVYFRVTIEKGYFPSPNSILKLLYPTAYQTKHIIASTKSNIKRCGCTDRYILGVSIFSLKQRKILVCPIIIKIIISRFQDQRKEMSHYLALFHARMEVTT